MRKLFYAGVIFFTVFPSISCSWFPQKPAPNDKFIPIYSGRVLNAKEDLRSAKVLIVPFKAGEGVESTGELDKVSLMIVKGIAEALDAGGLSIENLSEKNQGEAQYVIQGHIMRYQSPSKIKRIMPFQRAVVLSVKGKMMKVGSRRPVLVFEEEQQAKDRKNDGKYLGYVAGQNIGKFILSATAGTNP